jgi:hypothetical protein
MHGKHQLTNVINYFRGKFETFGTTPQGVDWNSREAQEIRFFQLSKVIDAGKKFSLLDFGSGYGALYDYLTPLGHDLHYFGYDIVDSLVEEGREIHSNNPNCVFTNQLSEVPVVDYAVVCGAFNMKLDNDFAGWTDHVISCLQFLDNRAQKGFSFDMLTKYSDPEKMRADLYYADPLFFFDYCKRNFSKDVALLHDYKLYDFTILVRKD